MLSLPVVFVALTLSAGQPTGPTAVEREARQVEAMLIAPC